MAEEKENEKQTVTKKSWDEFWDTGLLWFINMILHMFGWAIVLEVDDGTVVDAYPARVTFRGFGAESIENGYRKVSKWMVENAAELLEEAEQ